MKTLLMTLAALALMTATASATTPTLLYQGETSQGLPLVLRVTANGKGLTVVEFEWKAICANGQTHEAPIELGPAQVHSDSFSISGKLNTGGHVSISGHFISGGWRGQLARSGPSDFGSSPCDVSGVTWRALRNGGPVRIAPGQCLTGPCKVRRSRTA
ncbi:MAG TPA: hypothetical protein VGG41_13740 [Solirubrobacteraceae bacterium]|jgi:hypothetical protein